MVSSWLLYTVSETPVVAMTLVPCGAKPKAELRFCHAVSASPPGPRLRGGVRKTGMVPLMAAAGRAYSLPQA